MAYKVSRFALVYNPPTLMVEYKDTNDDAKYVKKINIKNLTKVKESAVLVKELRVKYPQLLGPNVVEEAQVKGLVERLMRAGKEAKSQNHTGKAPATAAAAAAPASSGTVMFKRVSAPTCESDLADLDLNVVSDEVNQTAKRIMDSRFEANRLKPGDPGYEWDRQVDFEAPTETADWDEDENEDEEE